MQGGQMILLGNSPVHWVQKDFEDLANLVMSCRLLKNLSPKASSTPFGGVKASWL